MKQISAIKLLVTGLLLTVMPLTAHAVKFSINGGVEFPIAGDVEYDVGLKLVEFELRDPVFCFDFSDNNVPVRLSVLSDDGATLLGDIGLNAALQYNLGSSRIDFIPGTRTQCFHEDNNGGFGLFGQAPKSRSEEEILDEILADSFEVVQQLSISYSKEEVPLTGGILSYGITIKNKGKFTVKRAAFQEVSSSGLLPLEGLICDGLDEAVCDAAVGDGFIRFENLNLAPGAEITLQVKRLVLAALEDPELHAGIVSGDFSIGTPAFDAEKTVLSKLLEPD